MKKYVVALLAILSVVCMSILVCACSGDEPVAYTPTYVANECGYIYHLDEQGNQVKGAVRFTVAAGADVTEITACPYDGYIFDKWSDGVTTATRQDKNVGKDITVFASFKREEAEKFTVKYIAGEHGSIEGEATQSVESESHAVAVTATPDKGYRFVKWSDGLITPMRREMNVTEDMQFTAEFEIITRQYKLNERISLESEYNKKTLTLTYGELGGVKLPVLQKERFTFGGWYYNGQKIADENGSLTVTDDFVIPEIIKSGSGRDIDITAKWTANETFDFKILVVYVTKINADLRDGYGNMHHVEYEMPELQRQLCHETTKLLKQEMDDMMDGLVDFQVDEYFTTQTVYTESFHQGTDNPGSTYIVTSLLPSYIPEVREKNLLDGYDATVTEFGFCEDFPTWDEAHRFESVSGTALPSLKGECEVFLDSFLANLRLNGATSLTQVLNGEYMYAWVNHILTFAHEIAHTIEARIHSADYHRSINISGTNPDIGSIRTNKMYYLNELISDGERVGIPYGFWKREIADVVYNVSFDNNRHRNMGVVLLNEEFGNIYMASEQEVVYGCDALAVIAEPFPGYRFVRWSDGVTTLGRKDRNITADFTVTAIFEPI